MPQKLEEVLAFSYTMFGACEVRQTYYRRAFQNPGTTTEKIPPLMLAHHTSEGKGTYRMIAFRTLTCSYGRKQYLRYIKSTPLRVLRIPGFQAPGQVGTNLLCQTRCVANVANKVNLLRLRRRGGQQNSGKAGLGRLTQGIGKGWREGGSGQACGWTGLGGVPGSST